MQRNIKLFINQDLIRKIVYSIDKANGEEHITYSIMTEGTLELVPRKKNRENPHYLHSVLYVENMDCIAKERQMTLQDFSITLFDTDALERDFEKISQGLINKEESKKDRTAQSIKLEYVAKMYEILLEYIAFPVMNIPSINFEGYDDVFECESPKAIQEIEIISKKVREYWEIGSGPITDLQYIIRGKYFSRGY